jgi:hypothetical protein
MTALVRTWTTTNNNVPSQATLAAQAAAVVLARKTLMVDAGWTVQSSSNGTTANSSDNWTTVADLTWAAAGVAHSWIVLRSPTSFCASGYYIYCLIDLSTGATNYHLWTITWSSEAIATGGTTTAAPTSATAGNRIVFTNKQFLRSTLANSKYHTKRSDSSDYVYLVSADASGYFLAVSGAFKAGNLRSGLNYPVLVLESFVDSGRGAPTLLNTNTTTHAVMWQQSGATVTSGSMGVLGPYMNGNDAMANYTSTGDFAGAYPDFPAAVANTTATGAIYGTLVDVALAPTGSGVLVGTEEPSSGSSTHEIVGAFWMPKNGGAASNL